MEKDCIAGSAKQLNGKIKSGIGKIIGDKKLQAEGAAQQAEGKVQNAVGSAKDALKDVVQR